MEIKIKMPTRTPLAGMVMVPSGTIYRMKSLK